MSYDGSSKLGNEIAKLYSCSSKNNNKISALVGEAKAALGVTTKSKILPDDVKLAIYKWHYDRLNPACDVQRDGDIQNVKQDGVVYDVKQDNNSLGNSADYDHIHFAVMIRHQGKPKRTTVMLEGYLAKALQRKHGLVDNPAIRVWIEQAIKSDGLRFDPDAPLTRQVKRIITESFV